MLIESYLQQYERMTRFLKRLENQNRDQQDYVDDMWSFFQHCFHLKDWIKNDPQISPDIGSKIEEKINASQTLKIIADLANRSKHFRLDKKREDANLTGVGVTIEVPVLSISPEKKEANSESSKSKYHITIKTANSHTFDGLQLAKDAVKEWDRIFEEFDIKKS